MWSQASSSWSAPTGGACGCEIVLGQRVEQLHQMVVVVVDEPSGAEALGEVGPGRHDRGQPETDDVADDAGREHLALRIERQAR